MMVSSEALMKTFEMVIERLDRVEAMLEKIDQHNANAFERVERDVESIMQTGKTKIRFCKYFLGSLSSEQMLLLNICDIHVSESDLKKTVRGGEWDDVWKYGESQGGDIWEVECCPHRFPWMEESNHATLMGAVFEEACVRRVPECIAVGGGAYLIKSSSRTTCLNGLTRIVEDLISISTENVARSLEVTVSSAGKCPISYIRYERCMHQGFPDREFEYIKDAKTWSRQKALNFVNCYMLDYPPKWMLEIHGLRLDYGRHKYV